MQCNKKPKNKLHRLRKNNDTLAYKHASGGHIRCGCAADDKIDDSDGDNKILEGRGVSNHQE